MMLPVLLMNQAFFFLNFGQSEKRNSKDVCRDVWLGRGGFVIFGFCSSQLSDMVFVQWQADSQTIILFTLLRSCQTNTMPTILLTLTLLGVLYSHGNAMSQEEKRKFRWVETTVEQLRCYLLTTRRIWWLAPCFSSHWRNQVVEMFDHAYQNYMVSCLSKMHRLKRIATGCFSLENSG